MQKNTLHSLGILIGALGAAAYSCSPSVDPGPGTGLGATGPGSGGNSTATGGSSGANSAAGGSSNSSGGSTASGGSNSATGGSFTVDIDASMSDAPDMVDEDAACGKGEANGTLKDVNMFVMYDRSWSMLACADSGSMANPPCAEDPPTTRWDVTSDALKQFFQNPAAAGLRVALRFFPDDNPAVGCDGYGQTGGVMGGFMGGFMGGGAGMPGAAGSTGAAGANCDVNACAQPLVDIAPLTADAAPTDTQEAKLIAAIDASPPPGPDMPNPNPATPTSAALGGAVQWATTYQMANPNSQTVIVLVTDGEPYGCDTNTQNIANIAANGLKAGIQTYVIGLGGLSSTVLDAIAKSGGTTKSYVVSAGGTATDDLLNTLLAIRGKAISCNIDIPKATTSGEQIDPTQINISYTDNTGTKTDYGLVEGGESACGDSLGWYFDNPQMPTQAILCPAACTQVQNDQTSTTTDKKATLAVLAGCKPHIITR